MLWLAGASAFIVTICELRFEHGAFPPRRSAWKAIGLWLTLGVVDAAVGVGVAAGLVAVEIDEAGATGAVRMLMVGVLAPLGLRSPIRKASVGGSTEGVGITYFYDVIRYRLDWALDERMTRVRRERTNDLLARLENRGWSPPAVASEIRSHLSERRKMSEEDDQTVREAVTASLTMPEVSERLRALVVAMTEARLHSLVEDLAGKSPPTDPSEDE